MSPEFEPTTTTKRGEDLGKAIFLPINLLPNLQGKLPKGKSTLFLGGVFPVGNLPLGVYPMVNLNWASFPLV